MDSVCLSHSLQSIWLQCHNCVRTTLHAITKEAYSKWSERTILRDYYNCETQVRTLRRQTQNSARIFCWHRRMNSIASILWSSKWKRMSCWAIAMNEWNDLALAQCESDPDFHLPPAANRPRIKYIKNCGEIRKWQNKRVGFGWKSHRRTSHSVIRI